MALTLTILTGSFETNRQKKDYCCNPWTQTGTLRSIRSTWSCAIRCAILVGVAKQSGGDALFFNREAMASQAPGLEAIYKACREVYTDQPNPLQVAAVVKYW